ncbi:MAG: SRPBCC family protein [Egibacteraceae bacterium]
MDDAERHVPAASPGPGGIPAEPSDPELPVRGWAAVGLPVERMWAIFDDVRGWPRWNPCFRWARVTGGTLREGALLCWVFNPIRSRYPYVLPASARIVEYEPRRGVTWKVTAVPGFSALHRYAFEAVDEDRCRFGSWEVAEGPAYRLLRPFWLAHFRYVRDASLAGARALPGRVTR